MCRFEKVLHEKSYGRVPGREASLPLPALPEQWSAAVDRLRVSLCLPAGDVGTVLREGSCDRRTTR